MRYALATLGLLTVLCLAVSDASSWHFRLVERNSSSGTACRQELLRELGHLVREIVTDWAVSSAMGETGASDAETCGLPANMLEAAKVGLESEKVWLQPASQQQVSDVLKLASLLNKEPRMIGGQESSVNFSASPASRGLQHESWKRMMTAGPSAYELADAAYSLLLHQRWSYVAVLLEAGDSGAVELSRILNATSRSNGRVCFPFVRFFSSWNATQAAEQLRAFAYSEKKMATLAVVYLGSGDGFLPLWRAVTGGSSTVQDTEKRLQFVLVGDSFGVLPSMINGSARGCHFAVGTAFVFPGILDPHLAQGSVANLLRSTNSTFSGLPDSASRLLLALKAQTSGVCQWSSVDSLCRDVALRYDFQALALAVALGGGPADFSTIVAVNELRTRVTDLRRLAGNFSFLDEFVRNNYETFSLTRGLNHSIRGFNHPIVKIYQAKLNGVTCSVAKVGEVSVKNAGLASQEYTRYIGDLTLYKFTAGNPDDTPSVRDVGGASACPGSCPECLRFAGNEAVQFSPGDVYLGALIPIFHGGFSNFDCTDAPFRSHLAGGYEYAMAMKFIVEWANLVSQGVSAYPLGFNASLLDPSLLLGLKDLMKSVHDRRTQRLRWGYVIINTCYSAPYTMKNLEQLLNGEMSLGEGFSRTQIVGFVGAMSSTQTIAASNLLKWYHLPLISFASTSTALTNFELYPHVLRTVVSDTMIVEAMVSVLKHYGVDYVGAVYQPSAYGESLLEELRTIASRESICVGVNISYACGSDESCKAVVFTRLQGAKARYVTYLGEQTSLTELLSYSNVENSIGDIIFLTTEDVGSSDAPFSRHKNVGLGVVSVMFAVSSLPSFAEYQNQQLTQLPVSANAISQWEKLHIESVHQCRLTDAFSPNTQFSVPCSAANVERDPVRVVESRTPFVVEAAATLVLGTLKAMSYICSVVTPHPACPNFFPTGSEDLLKRANLVIYGKTEADASDTPQKFSGTFEGNSWSFQKIFENRMGRANFDLLQYRRLDSTTYAFMKIGSFTGSSGRFFDSASALFAHEREFSTPDSPPCRSRSQCPSVTCANSFTQPTAAETQNLMGLLGLLLLPGLLGGFLLGWLLCRGNVSNPVDANYDTPYDGYTTAQEMGGPLKPTPTPRKTMNRLSQAESGSDSGGGNVRYVEMATIRERQSRATRDEEVDFHSGGYDNAAGVRTAENPSFDAAADSASVVMELPEQQNGGEDC